MVFCPPRHGKSELISRYLPAWYLGTRPTENVILTSHTYDLAAEFSGTARDLLAEYGGHFGNVSMDRSTWAKDHWKLRAGGGMRAAGVGGPITGSGANLFIIDDPIKDAEQATSPAYRDRLWNWWESTASTRLEPGGRVVLMHTRWHDEDLAGRLLREQPDRWRVISLPAIAGDDGADLLGRLPGQALWPERWPLETLKQIQKDKTPYWWQAMYQQRPGLFGENSWPESYFTDIMTGEWPATFDSGAIAIDPALGKDKKRGDYSAVVFVGSHNKKLYVDSWMGRVPPPTLVEQSIGMYVRYHPNVMGCEENGFQELLGPLFRQAFDAKGLIAASVTPIISTTDKTVRIESLTPLLSRGLLRIRNGSAHNRLLLAQLRAFPNADHDDGPDALEMATRLWGQYKAGRQFNDGLGSRLVTA